MTMDLHDTVIVGGGLQGAAIAMELAHRGRRSVILDQDERLVNRASLRNEGKIHLGLIYAADPTFSTASIQLQGALTFAPLLRRWLGARWNEVGISTPFAYLVAQDSLWAPEPLADHYDRLSQECRRRLEADARLDYLGTRPVALACRMADDDAGRWFTIERLAAVFGTDERAVDTDDLARVVRAAVDAEPLIRVLGSHRVEEITRTFGGIAMRGQGPEGTFALTAPQVVNCTWESRFRLDLMMGLTPPSGWLHRLKYRTLATLPASHRHAPSATMVLGAYGDVVVRPSGVAYLSWYPTSMRGWTHDVTPPSDWNAVCRGDTPADITRDVAVTALHHIDAWFPGIGACDVSSVDAGTIVAYGTTDVDDRQSGLHHRTRIGVTGGGDYFSVDPGKLTTAPLFAMDAVDAIAGATDERSWW
jgi:glycine/D-amino acid oxidase-like deaminating enzyme